MINKYLLQYINISYKKPLISLDTRFVPSSLPQVSLINKRATYTSKSTTMADYLTVTYVTVPSEEVGTELAR